MEKLDTKGGKRGQALQAHHLKEEQGWHILHLSLDATDDDLGVHHLVKAQQDPGQVGHHKHANDGNGNISHVDLLVRPKHNE